MTIHHGESEPCALFNGNDIVVTPDLRGFSCPSLG